MGQAWRPANERVRKYALSEETLSRVADAIAGSLQQIIGAEAVALHPELTRDVARQALRASDRDQLRRLLLAAETERDFALDELESDLRTRADQIAAFKERVARSRVTQG